METKNRRILQACSIIVIALNQLVPISAHPLENWTWRLPEKPDVTFFNSVAYGNGLYVAAGKYGVLAVSQTGSDWTPIEISLSKDLRAVRYLEGKFIAVGVGGTVLTSPDGGHWTSQNSGTTNTLRDVAFGNNTFVAVGDNNTLLCSGDGATWTPNAIGHSISRLVFGNGVFVGASDRQTVASLDGITWTNSTFEANPYVTSLAFGNGTFVTTVHSLSYPEHEKIYVSTDGLGWKSSLTNNRVNWFGEVRFGNNLFIAQLSYRTYLSKDGNTWVRAPSSPILTFLDFAGGKFFFQGPAMLWTTADGFSYATQPTTLDFSAVTFCNGRFLGLGKRSAVSTNGTTWTLGEGSPLSGGSAESFMERGSMWRLITRGP